MNHSSSSSCFIVVEVIQWCHLPFVTSVFVVVVCHSNMLIRIKSLSYIHLLFPFFYFDLCHFTLYILLFGVESFFDCCYLLIFVRTFLWLCDAYMSMWNPSPWRWCIAAGKQLAINQPVLTDKELEIVNSIVWRLLLTLTVAVPISDTPEGAYETY